ncbi:hypothetical protein JHFBIEKO_5228 [Methylobacterium mesophilicum]|nr:hypothetical protein JHFBIEKO_5228 [Methylobacterium mesophilicum]
MRTGDRPARARSRLQASMAAARERAATTARSVSSGAARGTPKTAMTSSPTNLSTRPPAASIAPAARRRNSARNAATSPGDRVSQSPVKSRMSANSTVASCSQPARRVTASVSATNRATAGAARRARLSRCRVMIRAAECRRRTCSASDVRVSPARPRVMGSDPVADANPISSGAGAAARSALPQAAAARRRTAWASSAARRCRPSQDAGSATAAPTSGRMIADISSPSRCG